MRISVQSVTGRNRTYTGNLPMGCNFNLTLRVEYLTTMNFFDKLFVKNFCLNVKRISLYIDNIRQLMEIFNESQVKEMKMTCIIDWNIALCMDIMQSFRFLEDTRAILFIQVNWMKGIWLMQANNNRLIIFINKNFVYKSPLIDLNKC